MTSPRQRTQRLLRAAAAAGIVLLLAQPAFAGPAEVSAAAERGSAAASGAAVGDKTPITCWVTAYGTGERSDGVLDAYGSFGTKCSVMRTTHALGGDPVPPEATVNVQGTVEYCSAAGLCKRWENDSGNMRVAPTTSTGFWIDVADGALAAACKLALPPVLSPACDVVQRPWSYASHFQVGDWCYADCREGGAITYTGVHWVYIPAGAGYRLAPGTAPLPSMQSGTCQPEGDYALRCTSAYATQVKYDGPPTDLPPAVDEVREECEDRLGKPACNPV